MIDVPRFERIVSLSDIEQQKYDLENNITLDAYGIAQDQLGRLTDTLSEPLDLSGLPEVSPADRGYYEDALFARLQPKLDRDRQQRETQLMNQGIKLGSEAYGEAQELQNEATNDAYLATILSAGDFAQQELSQSELARERRLQELLAIRNQPINEISALLSQGQVNMPQFSGFQGGSIAPTSVGDHIWKNYDAQMQGYNASVASNNAMMGGLFQLGGSLLGGPLLSDINMKENISDGFHFLDRVSTLRVPSWRYSRYAIEKLGMDDQLHVGPMAQDWAERFGGDGKSINPVDANGVLLSCVKELLDIISVLNRRVERLEGDHGIKHCRNGDAARNRESADA